MHAIWNDQIIAESEHTIIIDNNHYFPPDSIQHQFFKPSEKTTVCSWKGTANYYHIQVADKTYPDGAWCYTNPKPEAAAIKDHIAFYSGVEIKS